MVRRGFAPGWFALALLGVCAQAGAQLPALAGSETPALNVIRGDLLLTIPLG